MNRPKTDKVTKFGNSISLKPFSTAVREESRLHLENRSVEVESGSINDFFKNCASPAEKKKVKIRYCIELRPRKRY